MGVIRLAKKSSKVSRGFSLTFKLSLGFTLLITLLMGAVGISTYMRDRDAFMKETVSRGWAMMESMEHFAAHSLKAGDNTPLQKMLTDLKNGGYIKDAAVLDKDGRVVALGSDELSTINLSTGPLGYTRKTGNRRLMLLSDERGRTTSFAFASAVSDDSGTPMGYIYMLTDFRLIEEYLSQTAYNIIFNFVLASLAGLFLARLIIMRSVGRPVKELQAATEKVSVGDFSYKLQVTTKDELGRLAHAFNLMSDQLSLLFDSIKGIVGDMSTTSSLIAQRADVFDKDTDNMESTKQVEWMKEINSGAKRLARMSNQLNSLALQFKTDN